MERKPTSSLDALTPDSVGESPSLFLPNGVPPLQEGPDPFDPASLRLPQDFSAALGVKRALLTVPVKKPNREWFVRTHPDPAYQLNTAVIEIKNPDEIYLVKQDLWEDLSGEITFTTKMLILAVNRQNTAFFWPIRLPDPSGRVDNWSQSALSAAQIAMQRWVRVTSDMSLGAYSVFYADYDADPVWPERPMSDLLRIAFQGRYIDTLDHPILRQLRGAV
jgi:hypothetical protein